MLICAGVICPCRIRNKSSGLPVIVLSACCNFFCFSEEKLCCVCSPGVSGSWPSGLQGLLLGSHMVSPRPHLRALGLRAVSSGCLGRRAC